MDANGDKENADRWVEHLFSAKAVERGGVVRRATVWVEREIGRERLIAEVQERGFCLLETQEQLVIICNPGPLRQLV